MIVLLLAYRLQKESPEFRCWLVPEALLFVAMALPVLLPVLSLWTGQVSPAEMEWFTVRTSALLFTVTAGLWIYVRKYLAEGARAFYRAVR